MAILSVFSRVAFLQDYSKHSAYNLFSVESFPRKKINRDVTRSCSLAQGSGNVASDQNLTSLAELLSSAAKTLLSSASCRETFVYPISGSESSGLPSLSKKAK